MSVTSWFLVSSSGTRHRLPPEMIFVGREECELMLQSRSVDKQHAVVNYDQATDEHMLKDLGSLNGTFVNDLRIPDQTYITLKLSDVIRFGYDSHVYILERSQHKVPEEALKHEKYTSQLQMSMKALEARKREKERQHAEERNRDSSRSKQEKAEHKAALAAVASEAPVSRPTPLYGQPSWWGEDDAEHSEGQRPDEDPAENTKESYRQEVNASLSDSQAKSIYSYHREPSYFEIPTKEFQQRELHEVPTKDTDPHAVPVPILSPAPISTSTPTPPAVQSHASFTIEFDECTPGKIKIKDHVTKFSFRQQRKLPSKEAVTAPAEVMSAESKVVDWLVQSDVSMMQRWSRTEDMFSTNSDLPIYNKASTGHHHEDGTRGNSEDPVVNGKQVIQSMPSLPTQLSPPRPFTHPDSEELLYSSPPESHSPPQSQGKADAQQAFVIEFFDDNPRKKRSQTFTNNTLQPDSPPLRNRLEKKLGPSTPTQQYTIPLKGPGSGGPQRSGSLRREKTEDQINTSFSSHSSIQPRPFRSVGRRSKLAQDFTAEFLRESRQETRPSMNTTWERKTSPVYPTTSPPPAVMAAVPHSHQTPPSPRQPPVPYLTQASTVNQPVPLKTPLMSLAIQTMESTRSPEATCIMESTMSPEATCIMEATMSPEATCTMKATRSPEATCTMKATRSPEATCTMEATRSPEATCTMEATRSPEATCTMETTRSPKATCTMEAAQGLEAAQSLEATCTMEVGSPRSVGNEEDDALSEAGTYTIETEVQDEEVVEARNKIDQVFGVVEGPEQPSHTAAAAYKSVKAQDREERRESSSVDVRPAPGQGQNLLQVSGGSKWVSRWASLADSYTDSGPASGLFDIPSQIELSGGVGGRTGNQAMLSRNVKSVESEGQSSRIRRILPRAPLMEKNETPTPSVLVHQDTYSTYDVREKSSRAPCPQEGLHNLSVQDDLDPDSLSDASKSDDGSIVEQRTTPTPETTDKCSFQNREEERPRLPAKSTSFYIDSEERGSRPNTPKTERKLPPPPNTTQFSTATLTKQRSGQDSQKTVKPNSSAPNLEYQGRVSPQPKDISVSLVRQESFTKDQPSDAAQVTRLPHISSQPALNEPDPAEVFQGICSQDTHSYLKETEDALAALEAKLQAQTDVAPRPIDDTLSGESDIDSASTASQRSNQTAPKYGSKKPSITCGPQKERSSSSSFTQEPSRQQSAHDRLSEKRRPQGVDSSSNPEPGRRLGMRRSVGKHGSMDLSDDPQRSSLPYWPDTISSDQEGSRPAARKKYTAPLQKEDSSKSSKVAQALNRSNSMYAPRPTRASMLRRARLGEASDNEGTETDRISQEASTTTKASQDSKKQLSRLDMLALPRKRTSSFTTPSDTESSAPRTGFSNRSTESNSGSGRKASVAGPSSKPALGRASGAPGKPITRGRPNSAKYTSSTASSRRRQKGSDYTSTSEEEYDSGNQSTPKHKRSQTPSASRSQHLPPRPKPRSRDSDQESHEGDAYQNWSSHSAEIAKLSQDLAKDLAILAREIHDVAGDTDPQSSSASTMTTRDELVHPIPEAGVNYQRAPPGSPAAEDHDQTMMNDQEHNFEHKGWNQEEVVIDDLMLNPVSQISLAIRENTEQLAEKIKVLFHNKQDVWEEIEAKINAENDIPVLKGSNKEITSILKELRRVQRQLEVINTIIEPSVNLEPAKTSTPSAPSSAGLRPYRAPSRDWRSLGSQGGGGGGSSSSSRPSESVRRSAMASEAESYVV